MTSQPASLFVARAQPLAEEPVVLGPIIAVQRRARAGGCGGPMTGSAEFVSVYFTLGETDEVHVAQGLVPPPAVAGRDHLVLLGPHRYFAGVLDRNGVAESLPPSPPLRLAQRYLTGVLALDPGRLSPRQGELAAEAVRSLLLAASVADEAQGGLATRRSASLLARMMAHIDANLSAPLSAEGLCEALKCSRSALYRATASAGGVAGIVTHRRMLAVRDRLSDPAERRAVADIARANGFADVTQFSRRFRALFGSPPGEFRRSLSGRQEIEQRRLAAPVRHPRRPAGRL